MVNGKILLAVSPIPTSGNHFPSPTSYYEFDYVSNSFTQVNAPAGGLTTNEPCYVTNMLDLPDGSVLYADQGDNQYYIYTPLGTPVAAGKPTVNSIALTSCTQFRITGKGFNGISEGAGYGDDWQMASNYPVIRLTSGGNVYYCRTFNWNSTGVMRGNAADTAQFTLPSSLPAGTYSLVVTANGIASDPVAFNSANYVSFTGLAASYNVSDPPATLTGSPAGGTFSGPGVSGNTFNPANAGAGGPYTITYTICGLSTSHQTTVSGCSPPATPSSISVSGGSAKVCPGDSRTYTTPLVAGVTSYSWTIPTGAAINNGQGTRTINVTYNSGFTANGTLSVVNTNGCGSSQPKTINVNRNVPATPSSITGTAAGLCGASNVAYSVTAVSGITYNWTVPAGATINNGQGTNIIHVTFPSTNFTGTVSVKGHNTCGDGNARNLSVKAAPATPAAISGNATVCPNSTGNPFSIAPVPSATNYTWTGPTGSHITGNGVTSSGAVLTTTATNVTVDFGAVTSTSRLKARANNNCVSGTSRTLSLIPCTPRLAGTDVFQTTVYPNPSHDVFNVIFNSASAELFTLTVRDLLGKELFTKEINADEGLNHFELQTKDGWLQGVYILTLHSADGMTGKLMITKE